MPSRPPLITRIVWILSLVSLFADFASEMLYPVVPVYLREIGFSVAMIGMLEGLAEFIVGITKGYFGQRSDQLGQRLPFIRLGYGLSAISKPLMAMFNFPAWIFLARSTDRLGKGLRTAARDALLSGQASFATRARVFSFHRGWDTVGAVFGPAAALVFLHFYPGNYKALFFWALIPGAFSVALLFLLSEEKTTKGSNGRSSSSFFAYFSYWKEGSPAYRQLLAGLLLFALANSSDAFLLLQAKSITGKDSFMIGAYILYNLIYAAAAYPMGILADKWGYKKTWILGITLFILVYGGFAINRSTEGVFVLFIIYGLFAAATEGISKAWISNLSETPTRGTALGFFSSAQSLCTLVSSSVAGLIWSGFGPVYTFSIAALLAALSAVLIGRVTRV